MPRIILLIAVATALFLLYRHISTLPPHLRRAQYIKLGIAIAAVVIVLLTLTGRMHWLGAALTGLLIALRQLLPTLIRLFPMLSSLGQGKSQASAGQHSTVETSILRMNLAHDSGVMSGVVLTGAFKDWLLEEMDRSQLQQLLDHCRAKDQDSASLLESYLQQRFGADYETEPDAAQPAGSSGMNRKEALAVLGLAEQAGREEIIAAHRKLMQKIHPDRGGSDYLAAKINQAKDLLLGE